MLKFVFISSILCSLLTSHIQAAYQSFADKIAAEHPYYVSFKDYTVPTSDQEAVPYYNGSINKLIEYIEESVFSYFYEINSEQTIISKISRRSSRTIQATNEFGQTLLHMAIMEGYMTLAKYLIDNAVHQTADNQNRNIYDYIVNSKLSKSDQAGLCQYIKNYNDSCCVIL